MLLKLATYALLPAVLIQGYHVKKNTIRLPEPEGERRGITGQGKPLSILIIGDSAAAGVGVSHQKDALLGALIDLLQSEFEVHWHLCAKTGDTTSKLIEKTNQLDANHYDVVITSVGVNDVTQLMPAKKWIRLQKRLYESIQSQFNPDLILATGVPPMHLFPALPKPLSWLLGQYAQQMNQQLIQYVNTQANMRCIQYDIQHYQDLKIEMAEDGFHPSKDIYQIWAGQLYQEIRSYISLGTSL